MMGCYIDPPMMTKEDWLAENGTRTTVPCRVTEKYLPVCLVDNKFFKAAAVAYSEHEVQVFSVPDGRFKRWYKVERAKLRTVSNLSSYENPRSNPYVPS